MQFWIQKADFSITEYEGDLTAILDAYKKHDWTTDYSSYAALESQDPEFFPPALGIDLDDGRTLNLCPLLGGGIVCRYYFKKKLFGFLPLSRTAFRDWTEPPPADGVQLIERFVADDHQWLLRRSREGF